MASRSRKPAKRTTAPRRRRVATKAKSPAPKTSRARSPAKAEKKPGRAKAAKPKAEHSNSRVARLESELRRAQERQAATSEILRIISQSPADLQPVFDAIVLAAVRLIHCDLAFFMRCDATTYVVSAHATSEGLQTLRRPPEPIDPSANFPARAIATKQTLHLSDWSQIELPAYEQRVQDRFGVKSSLYLPVLHEGACIGLLVLASKRINGFGESDIALAESFRDQALIAIENARLFNETQESLQQQTATADVLKVISRSAFDLQTVLDTLVKSATQLCEAGEGIILQPRGDGYGLAAHWGLTPAKKDFLASITFRPDDGGRLTGRVLITRNVVHIRDVLTEPGFVIGEDPDPARTRLGVPLLRDGIPLGVFVLTRMQFRPFTDRQIELVQTFAAQAVIAIENVRLFNETKEALAQQTATSEVLQVISSSTGDLQPVFDQMLEKATAVCGAKFGLMGLFDGDIYRRVASYKVPDAFLAAAPRERLPDPEGPIGIVGRTGQVVRVDDLTRSELYLARRPATVVLVEAAGARTLVVVPMLRDRQPIGAISIYRTEVRPFSDEQVELLKNFANQAVIAIENTRLFNETREALQQQTATADILKVIASSPSEVRPVFDAILARALHLCEAAFGFLAIHDGTRFEFAAQLGIPEALAAHFRGGMDDPQPGDAHWRLLEGEDLVHNLDQKDEAAYRSGNPLRRAVVDLGGARSALVVALRKNGLLRGSVTIYRKEVRPFSASQIELLRHFADQAVIAIENTRLFNETQEALERQTATADILKVIASSPADVQPVFQAIAERSNRLINGLSTAVYSLVDNAAHLMAFTPVNPAADAALRAMFPRPLSQLAWQDSIVAGETYLVQDAEIEFAKNSAMLELARLRGWRSSVAVPLVRDSRPIGVITVTRVEPGPFDDHHVQLLKTFADQAVIAIENVRLFNETQEALERQTATADILKVIASSPSDVQPVFDAIAESSNRLVGGLSTAVVRIVGDVQHLVAFTRTTPEADAALQAVFPRSLSAMPWGERLRIGEIREIQDTEVDWVEFPELRDVARLRGYRSLLFVPLVRDGTTLGIISVTRVEVGTFAAHHIQLLQTFADQAVIAIENVRLFNETQEALERQTATADILKVIAASPSDVRPVFEAIASRSKQLVGGFSTAVYRFIEGICHLEAFTPTNPAADEILQARFPVPIAGIRQLELAQAGGTVEIADTEAPDNSELLQEIAQARGFRALLHVPLMSHGVAIGVIVVTRTNPGAFSRHHVELLHTFADQAVIAIENVRLFDEVQARTRDLTESLEQQTATSEVLKVISSSPGELDPVFQAMLSNATRICEAEFGVMYRYDNGRFQPAALLNVPTAFADFVRERGSFVPSPGVPLDRLLQTREVTYTADEAAQPIPGAPARLGGARSLVGVPMLKENELVGAIIIYRQEVRPFTEKQVALVTSFANQAVIAIENTRLLKELRARTDDLSESLQQQTATSDVLKVISRSAFDLDSVMNTLTQSAAELCKAEIGALYLREGDMLVARGATGVDAGQVDFLRRTAFPIDGSTYISRTFLAGTIRNIADVAAETEVGQLKAFGGIFGFKSILFVPLMREARSVGIFAISRRRTGLFSQREIDLIQTFADQAVIAIENVRLFNETQEALERQTATADILKVIASSPSDVQPVFEAIAERSNRLIGGRSTAVYGIVDDVMHLMAFTRTSPEADAALQASFPRPFSEFQWVDQVRNGVVVEIADAETQWSNDPRLREVVRLRGFRSVLFVPLLRDGTVIGVISVTRVEAGKFAPHHVQLLQTFADQAVIAIGNVRLFDEVQARTRDLTEALTHQTGSANILRVIASSPTDVEPVLQSIAESACELCEANDANVLLREGDYLYFRAHYGPIAVDIDKWPIGRDWASGRAVVDRATVHVPDVFADEEFAASRKLSNNYSGAGGIRSVLAVPLLREGESIGAILLRRQEVQPYTEKQIALLKTFADQAVIAIGNVRLFDEVQARTKELAASLDDLRAAQDRLVQTEKLASLGQLTAGIAHEIKNPLNFVNNFSALSVELTEELSDLLKPAPLDGRMRGDLDELTSLIKENLEKVVQHGKRADSIVKNMLLHSREGSGEQRPTDINALLDESLNLAYHGARAEKPGFNITLQRDFDEGAGAIQAFPQEITRAFLNLISNGFYAATRRKADNGSANFEPLLSAATRNLGGHVEIRIRDNGSGIPPEVREKMFNPFFTTKPAGEGTGLGLSMTHDIVVKQHGGRIDVATEPGQYTEFTILLPRAIVKK